MRFGRFEDASRGAFWAVIDSDGDLVKPIDGSLRDWAPAYLAEGPGALELSGQQIKRGSLRQLAPLDPNGRVFACGGNYADHLLATGVFTELPDAPVGYLKADSSVIGPEDELRYASYTNKLDYEVELVAVVGRPIEPGTPPSAALLGYTVGNDASIRDAPDPFRKGAPDLYVVKAADRLSPLGPDVVSTDEVGGLGQPSLDIMLRVNGETRQHDNTKNVIFSIDEMLSWVNLHNVLRPGDVMYTGSPSGCAMETGEGYLQPGDVVEAEIERLGVLRNTVGQKET